MLISKVVFCISIVATQDLHCPALYSSPRQKQIQSFYWSMPQTNIHLTVLYYGRHCYFIMSAFLFYLNVTNKI